MGLLEETGTTLWIIVRLFTNHFNGLLGWLCKPCWRFSSVLHRETFKDCCTLPATDFSSKPVFLWSFLEWRRRRRLPGWRYAGWRKPLLMDYDVWKDEEAGYVKIEKYAGHLYAVQCPECNTRHQSGERRNLKAPTETKRLLLSQFPFAGYCGYKAKKAVTLKASTKFEGAAATV